MKLAGILILAFVIGYSILSGAGSDSTLIPVLYGIFLSELVFIPISNMFRNHRSKDQEQTSMSTGLLLTVLIVVTVVGQCALVFLSNSNWNGPMYFLDYIFYMLSKKYSTNLIPGRSSY